MAVEFEFFENELGNSDPADVYRSLDSELQVKFTDKKQIIEKYGFQQVLRSKFFEKIKGIKEDIYEIKIKWKNKTELRFLGCIRNNVFWILHIFWKKSQRGINHQIKLAIERSKLIK